MNSIFDARSLIVLLCFLGAACSGKGDLLARVGECEIFRSDVEFRNRIIRTESNTDLRDLGFKQLFDAFVEAEILRLWGQPVTDSLLEAESDRIQRETLRPEILRDIQSIFGLDHQAYLKVYVLPVYVSRTLYFNLFLKDLRIHESTYKKARTFLDQARKEPQKLNLLAEEARLQVENRTWDEKWGWISEGEPRPKQPLPDPKARTWMQKLKTIKIGDFYPYVIDRTTSWQVVQVIEKKKKTLKVRTVFVPKEAFDDWKVKQKFKLKIESFSKI